MSASAADAPPTITENGKTYYQLSTVADLYWFAEQVNSGLNKANSYNAKLMNDIDINPGANFRLTTEEYGGQKHWTPIGINEVSYKGIFDGQGYVIKGIVASYVGSDNVGFFGTTDGAEIRNLGIENSFIIGNHYDNKSVGGIVGCATSGTLITNCYYAGLVKGYGYIGGIVGQTKSSAIRYCYNTGQIRTNSLAFEDINGVEFIGGIVGNMYWSSIRYCYNVGELSATNLKEIRYGVLGDKCKNSTAEKIYNLNEDIYYSSTNKTAEQFASGEVASLLNDNATYGSQVFYQNIDNGEEVDAIPKFKGGTVYMKKCAGVVFGYSNSNIDYDVHKTPVGQSCTNDFTCTVCGTAVAAALYHTTPRSWDCTEGKYCAKCDYLMAYPKDHNGGTATCNTKAICRNCNKSYGEIDENNHDIIPHEGKAATCVEKGYESYNTCSRCDYTSYKEIEIDKNAHTGNYVYEVGKKSPTCGVNGFTGDTVCECSTVMVSGTTIPATGDHVGGTATCIAQAICTVCSQSYGDIDSDNHSYNYVIIKEQTHYEDGLGEYKCECGDSYTEIIKMDQHNYYHNWVEVYPTHFYDGLRKFVCTCGYVKNESIPKITTHNYETSYVYADCTNEGYVLHSCECGDSYKTNQTVALGHEDNNHDGKCDNRCGYDFTKDCDHMCHKGGFIYKFCLFFWKLFKMNKTCSCGMYHY
jgi:hypothetical protein